MKYLCVCVGLLTFGQISASAYANEYCRAFIDQMETGTLYAVKCRNNSSCLQKVAKPKLFSDDAFLIAENKELETLEPSGRYNFIFKTEQNFSRNSLVVVQTKRLDNPARIEMKPVGVKIRRDALKFSCQLFAENVFQSAWPRDDARGDQVPSVSFDKYDQFHRYGYTAKEERSHLWNRFHVAYHNGSTCVSTLDPARRFQFLLYERNNIPSKFVAFLERINVLSPSAALAANKSEMAKYEKLKVVVTNYQIVKNPTETRPGAGCFGFSASTGGNKTATLTVSMSDLEENAPYFPLDQTVTWNFEVRKNPPQRPLQ